MKKFDLEIYNNDFATKDDMKKFLMDILDPLEERLTCSGTRLSTQKISSGNEVFIGDMEGFMRLIWGLASDDELSADHPWWQRIRQGLVNGTNPEHPDYYGDVPNNDQRLVEMASVGYAMTLRPDAIYEPLSDEEKNQLIKWLNQVNICEAYPCNWKFFRVIVDIGFACNGIPFDIDKVNDHLQALDSYYVDNGWYRDGDIDYAHVDYYGPFAMHFYGLFYAKYMPDEFKDNVLADKFIERAKMLAKDLIYWHDDEGAMLPYGRSLTYRYAQGAFWSMLAVMDIELPFDYGVLKGLIMRHLRWWHQWPIYDSNGQLTIGYVYPNQFMSEDYNASGSPYWALKIMAILMLPRNHKFWSVEEKQLPKLNKLKKLTEARMIVTRDDKSHHIMAYNAGSYHTNGHTHVECKYEKFVYSSYFAFSVPRSYKHLNFGAYDNTLAVSEDGVYYRHKDKNEHIEIEDNKLIMTWLPYHDVTIKTTIICDYPWHIRIYEINSKRPLILAEGGFAIGKEPMIENGKHLKVLEDDESVYVSSEFDYSCIVNLEGYTEGVVMHPSSNTNIMNPRTIIPTLKADIGIGTHRLCSFVAGDRVSIIDVDNGEIDLKKVRTLIEEAKALIDIK